MKVLVVNDSFAAVGGAEKYSKSIVDALKDDGHIVETYTFHPRSTKINFFLTIFNPFVLLEIREKVKKEKPDVVHVNNFSRNLSGSIFIILHRLRIPTVWTVHDFEIACPKLSFVRMDKEECEGYSLRCLNTKCVTARTGYTSIFYYLFQFIKVSVNRSIIKKSNAEILCPNLALMEHIEKTMGRTSVSHNPNYITEVDPSGGSDKKYLLCVGTLTEGKAFDLAIVALHELKKKNQSLELDLFIVGEGPRKKALEKLCAELNMKDAVHFTGYREGRELSDLFKHCSLVIIPSRYSENFPLVALEAMSYGKPIIASDVRGLNRVIDKTTGILFTNDRPNELATAIESLMNDQIKRREMGENGRRLILTTYSKRSHVMRLEGAYERAIERIR